MEKTARFFLKATPWSCIATGVIVGLLIFSTIFFPLITKDGYLLFLDLAEVPGQTWGLDNQWWQYLRWLLVFQLGAVGMAFLLKLDIENSQLFCKPSEYKCYQWLLVLPIWFYLANPFVYQRLLVGHWKQLLGYALLPWLIWLCLKWIRDKKFSQAVFICFFIAFLVWQVSHYFFIIIPFLVATILVSLKNWNLDSIKSLLSYKTLIIAGLLFFLTWLIQSLSPASNKALSFSYDDFLFYNGTVDFSYGLFFHFFSLHGFWREGSEMLIINSQEIWFGAFLWLCFIMLMGALYKARNPRWLFFWIFPAFVAFILSLGSSQYTWQLTQWLVDNVPYYGGMRESQKFLAALALCQAVLIMNALVWLSELTKKNLSKVKANLIKSMFIFLSTFGILINSWYLYGAFQGQLKLASYPTSWYQAKDELIKSSDTYLLELPFYLYHLYPFHNRTSPSAVDKFFSPIEVLASSNAQTKIDFYLYPKKIELEMCYEKNDWLCFKKAMMEAGITHVLYQKEVGRRFSDDLLKSDSDLEVLFEDEFSIIFTANFY